MTQRRLIVNADDCNLTPGVTCGILAAHDRGIVTSTTLMMNLPLEPQTVKEIKKRSRLGLGVHLNVTLGRPLNLPSKVRSLIVDSEGNFKRPADYLKRLPSIQEVVREYSAQITLFEKKFGQKPDHLDTHHHLHDHPLFFRALAECARQWRLPVRRSRTYLSPQRCLTPLRGQMFRPKTTDYLFGNLEASTYWQKDSLLALLQNLPPGTSEIACHPAYCDPFLRQISSMKEVREKELSLFVDGKLRKLLRLLGIELIRFSQI